jgi:hypothetical protein
MKNNVTWMMKGIRKWHVLCTSAPASARRHHNVLARISCLMTSATTFAVYSGKEIDTDLLYENAELLNIKNMVQILTTFL